MKEEYARRLAEVTDEATLFTYIAETVKDLPAKQLRDLVPHQQEEQKAAIAFNRELLTNQDNPWLNDRHFLYKNMLEELDLNQHVFLNLSLVRIYEKEKKAIVFVKRRDIARNISIGIQGKSKTARENLSYVELSEWSLSLSLYDDFTTASMFLHPKWGDTGVDHAHTPITENHIQGFIWLLNQIAKS